jgi:hypothetical protein
MIKKYSILLAALITGTIVGGYLAKNLLNKEGQLAQSEKIEFEDKVMSAQKECEAKISDIESQLNTCLLNSAKSDNEMQNISANNSQIESLNQEKAATEEENKALNKKIAELQAQIKQFQGGKNSKINDLKALVKSIALAQLDYYNSHNLFADDISKLNMTLGGSAKTSYKIDVKYFNRYTNDDDIRLEAGNDILINNYNYCVSGYFTEGKYKDNGFVQCLIEPQQKELVVFTCFEKTATGEFCKLAGFPVYKFNLSNSRFGNTGKKYFWWTETDEKEMPLMEERNYGKVQGKFLDKIKNNIKSAWQYGKEKLTN